MLGTNALPGEPVYDINGKFLDEVAVANAAIYFLNRLAGVECPDCSGALHVLPTCTEVATG